MTTTLFTPIDSLTERERAVAELVARFALHAEVDPALASQVPESPALRQAIERFERQLAQQSPTLSNLLASTAKSKCCS